MTDLCLTIPQSYLNYVWREIREEEKDCYFYHPDHLGSSSWITDRVGAAVQHLHYLPWGETYVDQKSNRFDGVRYTFSAKEKDAETGYSYFGARYYSSDLSVWLSVDPMSDKYPSMSPYVYCANNPVKLVDPNGEEMIDNPIFGTAGNLLGTDGKGWSGTPIVMNESDFKQGMSHSDAERKGTYLNEYGKGIKISDNDWNKIESHGGDKRLEPYIQNQSSGKIYFKPETTIGQYQNDGAYPLEAGKDLYMPVDGVATEYYSNRVMKIPDNKRITVFSGGKVSFKGSSISRITPIYGWIYSDAIQSGDNSWDNLFRAACTTGGRCTGRGYDCDMMVKPLIYGFYFAKGLSSRIKNGK